MTRGVALSLAVILATAASVYLAGRRHGRNYPGREAHDDLVEGGCAQRDTGHRGDRAGALCRDATRPAHRDGRLPQRRRRRRRAAAAAPGARSNRVGQRGVGRGARRSGVAGPHRARPAGHAPRAGRSQPHPHRFRSSDTSRASRGRAAGGAAVERSRACRPAVDPIAALGLMTGARRAPGRERRPPRTAGCRRPAAPAVRPPAPAGRRPGRRCGQLPSGQAAPTAAIR